MRGWCLKYQGVFLLNTFSMNRQFVIDEFIRRGGNAVTWEMMKDCGYSCVEVEVEVREIDE